MTRYQKPVRPNPKKEKSARRKRNSLYWKTGGRQIIKETACPDCIKLQKEARAKLQKENPAPVGMVYRLNPYIMCESCQKEYDKKHNRKPNNKVRSSKQSNS